MPIKILPGSLDDISELVDLKFAAFATDFHRRVFPLTQDVREWYTARFQRILKQPHGPTLLVKAVDTSIESPNGKHPIVGLAIWSYVTSNAMLTEQALEGQAATWPASSDAALFERYYRIVREKRIKYMGSRAHCCMFLNGTLLRLWQ